MHGPSMDPQALTLLGGMSPARFMSRHWQRKPLVRSRLLGFVRSSRVAPRWRACDAESRLVQQTPSGEAAAWLRFARVATGPRAVDLCSCKVDLHDERVHALMQQFRQLDALDDHDRHATDGGGGAGPHFDSYDVSAAGPGAAALAHRAAARPGS